MKKNFWHAQDGATAIEFAILAIPFIFLLTGIIELAIMYGASAMLEGATNSAARQVRTGQLQAAPGDPEATFRDALCDYLVALVSCADVIVDGIPVDSFMDVADLQPQYDENGTMIPQGFTAAGSNERMLIRTSYDYKMLTPFIGTLLAGNSSGTMHFMSTIVLQVEPYDLNN
jgi:Flp pilus assembly protein TadG